jgi:hypothetical protein
MEVAVNTQMGGGNIDEAAEADVLEQQRTAVPADAETADRDELPLEADPGDAAAQSQTPPDAAPRELPLEADPEDVVEQRREVGAQDDEDYLH